MVHNDFHGGYTSGGSEADRKKLYNCCCRCKSPFNGAYFQISIPTAPVCYGSDEAPDITLMYPHFMFDPYRVCVNCHMDLIKFLVND